MSTPRIGIWFIGARGGVSTAATLGLAALRRQLTPETGLVSAQPKYSHLEFPSWDQYVIGGHEIRKTSLVEAANQFHQESRVFSADVLKACQEDLETADQNISPGILWNVGSTILDMAEDALDPKLSASDCYNAVQADLNDFRDRHQLEQVVVINLASTEAPIDEAEWPASSEQAREMVQQTESPLPASSIYAMAALDLGMPYINFTPSLGATPAGIDQLAREKGACHAGRDGKTGETLLKSVLGPMFTARNLEVMSWVGHNIFGNLDGKVLDNPINKASKVRSKDHLLEQILGYPPQTLVTIEHINSMADWKTAWDHIHFQGFLNTPMTMQFTWQGCDSLLAAPLVLDLVRFTLLAQEKGESGNLTFLCNFFKSPQGTEKQDFFQQMTALDNWISQFS